MRSTPPIPRGESPAPREYEMFVARGEHRFVLDGDPVVLTPRIIGVRWSMVRSASGEGVVSGIDVLAIDDDGRIRSDYHHVG